MYRSNLASSYEHIRVLESDLYSAKEKLLKTKQKLRKVKENDLVMPLVFRRIVFYLMSFSLMIVPFILTYSLLYNTYILNITYVLVYLVIIFPVILSGLYFFFTAESLKTDIERRRRDVQE